MKIIISWAIGISIFIIVGLIGYFTLYYFNISVNRGDEYTPGDVNYNWALNFLVILTSGFLGVRIGTRIYAGKFKLGTYESRVNTISFYFLSIWLLFVGIGMELIWYFYSKQLKKSGWVYFDLISIILAVIVAIPLLLFYRKLKARMVHFHD